MAGREKVTKRKLHNMGIGEIADANDLANQVKHELGEFELTQEQKDLAFEMANLTPNEFLSSTIGGQRMLVMTLLNLAIKTAGELKARQIPAALKYSMETLREMQGDASQHVSKVKRGFTPEEMKDILDSLPKKADIEVQGDN
jgi:polyhydroxyalkanoate synthesis regulator protein